MNLDDFLIAQDRRALACIIEEIDQHASMVRITPWSPSRGIIRAGALAVPRALIRDATPRGIEVEIRGMLHLVVGVSFTDDESGILLASIIHQLTANLALDRGDVLAATVAGELPVEGAAPSIRRDWCGWHWPTNPDKGSEKK